MSDNYADHSGHDGLTVIQWKIVALVTLPMIELAGILCSIYLSSYKDSLVLVCSTCFAAGILIATGISHMLPESQEVLASSFGEFPLAYTLFGACYIFLLFIEVAAERFSENMMHNDEKVPQDDQAVIIKKTSNVVDIESGNDISGHFHAHVHSGHDIANPWAGLFLTLVLSFHSTLECLALGSNTDLKIVVSTYTAIAVHKLFEGFALGSGLVASGYWMKEHRWRFYSCTLTSLLLNIIPIEIGIAMAEVLSRENSIVGILLALVGGSFFYVGASEFVTPELKKMRALKLPVFPVMLSLMAGYVMMVLVTAYTHPEHEHGH